MARATKCLIQPPGTIESLAKRYLPSGIRFKLAGTYTDPNLGFWENAEWVNNVAYEDVLACARRRLANAENASVEILFCYRQSNGRWSHVLTEEVTHA